MGSSAQNGGTAESKRPLPRQRRLRYELRINLYSVLIALPGMLTAFVLIWMQSWSLDSKLILIFILVVCWWLLALGLHEQAIRPLQTMANVVGALREEDYSFRARGAFPEDALGELSFEVNALADLLSHRRIRAIEATALLRRVVEEVDAPLFAFDPKGAVRLVNPAGEKLLQRSAVRILGRTAEEIGLADCLNVANGALVSLPANQPRARWLVRQSKFRERGVPHTLLVLLDASRALREEERNAWQKLIRVLGHELNNSLAPIRSIAGSLGARLDNSDMNPEQREDFEKGLGIIEARSGSLNRFVEAYRQLAQMPVPAVREVELYPILERVALLETRLPVTILRGPDVTLIVDPDQIEQMLINLVRNAVEAALEAGPTRTTGSGNGSGTRRPQVTVSWKLEGANVVLSIDDNGPGLFNPSNAFVPFYTTKPSGSGIGLALSRQIAEAHGGSISLSNREGKSGCRVQVGLPRGMGSNPSHEPAKRIFG
jgi:two-component system, NtrC family, nitrogen regulation sensor histidine kinase NtrY